jgi:tetratricopeptide (TPR) repeat protein
MPGNRANYESEMNKGHSAAWEQKWPQAAAAYTKAIQEFPEDPEAHIHLGLSLLNSGRLDDALKVYKRANVLQPSDPIPLEKSADVLARMGRMQDAAEQYDAVAVLYVGQGDLEKAIDNWERATELTPGLVKIHANLAQAYERTGEKKKAVREYLILAFNFKRLNDVNKAIKAVERAIKLDEKNAEALNMLRALKSGGEIRLADVPEQRAPKQAPPPAAKPVSWFDINSDLPPDEEGDENPLGPLGEAMDEALSMLAVFVMEADDMEAIGYALQAMEAHRQGDFVTAVEGYKQAETRLRHPSLKMNLGALLVLNDNAAEAVKHLGEAVMEPSIATGAFHALGLAYYKLGNQKLAVKNLLRSLQQVDMQLSTDGADVDEIYNKLQKTFGTRTDEQLAPINKRFVELLTGSNWRQRIPDTRRSIESVLSSEGEKGLFEFVGSGDGKDTADKLTSAVGRIDRYIRQGLLTLAMDEAHYAVEFSPSYLPVHTRMAEVMMREGRVRQAINKYNTIARLYLVRGEHDRASSILGEVLDMAPLDVAVRQNLIELLEQQQRMPEALDQYIALADTYQKLGNADLSRETYAGAERLAKRINAPVEKLVQIKHQMAEIEQLRLEVRKAQRLYEEITELSPNDDRAQKALIDIYFSQGNTIEAIKRLDGVLRNFAKNKQVNKLVQTLEELLRRYPQESGLLVRLSQVYGSMGKKKEAIAQLDKLGELQLEAGQNKEAASTIRQIITLGPENLEDYKRLLSQLGG